MTGCAQRASTLECLVKWALVHTLDVQVKLSARLEPDHWAVSKENLRFTLVQVPGVGVPSASFDPHSDNMDSVYWRLNSFRVIDDFKVNIQSIDGQLLSSSIILESSSKETLCEVELIDLENLRDALFNPVREELKTSKQVFNIASKRFQGWVRLILPQIRCQTVIHLAQASFKLCRKQDFSLDGSLQILE